MIDIKLIRENSALIKTNCRNRQYEPKFVDEIVELDKKWRALKAEDDSLRGERNKVSESVNQAKKAKDEKKAKRLIEEAKKIAEKITKNEVKENELKHNIDVLVSMLPNIQHKDNPIGGVEKNKEIHKVGKISKGIYKSHLELGEKLGMIDMKRAVKVAGAGFYILTGELAKLQRALIQYMLDFHVKNGFTEINPPQLVNRNSVFGTGNLPKFEDQLYKTNDDLILVPTAEVVVTNIFSGEILNEKDLPKKYCAFTQCYRTEVGRKTGEEGLFRLHEFEKVEMVYFCKQEDSWKLLEEMTSYAEEILKELGVPFRRLLLATADAGFSSAKTYDLEVWSPALNRWLETSSCSNCTDFQARRMNTRYQGKDGLKLVHTLNGSGLALPRLMISIMENYQNADGTINIPKVLQPYMLGKKVIGQKIEEKKK
jgi:seryl-tRNA synthetase